MENNIKPFGIRRNLFFIKDCFTLLFRRFVEYKANFYSSFFLFFFWYLAQFIFLLVLSNNFGTYIGWSFNEFVLFIIFVNLIWNILGLFNWGGGLYIAITKGNLNVLLPRPLSTKLKFYFYNLDETGLFFILSNVVYIFGLIFYFKPVFYFSFFGFVSIFLLMVFFTLLWLTFDSFNFYSPKFSEIFIGVRFIEDNLQFYPGKFFEETKLKLILNLFPMYFVSSLLVPIWSNNITSQIYFQFYLMCTLLIITVLILMINWHYGLKRYEAFG